MEGLSIISVTFYPTKSFFPHAVYISQLGLVDTVNLQDMNSEGKLYKLIILTFS